MTSSFERLHKKAEAILRRDILQSTILSVDMALEDFCKTIQPRAAVRSLPLIQSRREAWKLIEEAYHYHEENPSRKSGTFDPEALKLDPENLDAKQMLLTFQRDHLNILKGLIALKRAKGQKWDQGQKNGLG